MSSYKTTTRMAKQLQDDAARNFEEFLETGNGRCLMSSQLNEEQVHSIMALHTHAFLGGVLRGLKK